LKESTNGKNTYGGGVGIYWPHRGGFTRILPDNDEVVDIIRREGTRESVAMQKTVVAQIMEGHLNQRIRANLTVSYIESQHNLRALDELKRLATISEESKQFIQLYEDEMKVQASQIENLDARNRSLEGQLELMKIRQSEFESERLIEMPEFSEIYEGEISSTIYEALERVSKQMPDGRRKSIIKKILNTQKPNKREDEYLGTLKAVLDKYEGMDSKTRKELTGLGFIIEDGGKHYRMTHRLAPQYTMTLSKTPSDWRAGKNVHSQVKRTLFS